MYGINYPLIIIRMHDGSSNAYRNGIDKYIVRRVALAAA